MKLFKRVSAGLGVIVAAMLFIVAGPTSPAQADGEDAKTYDALLVVDPDGTLHVTATITFAAVPTQVVQRFTLTQEITGSRVDRFTVTFTSVEGGGVTLTEDKDYTTFTITPSATTVVIKYDVVGAALNAGRGSGGVYLSEVIWPVLQGLSVGVTEVTGRIVPGGEVKDQAEFEFKSLSCASGTVAAPTRCTMYGGGTFDNPYPFFTDGPRSAGEVVIFGFTADQEIIAPNEQIEELWTLGRAFSVDIIHLLAALAVLGAGGALMFWLLRSKGADVSSVKDPTVVASFVPTGAGTVEFRVADEVRPGHVGTVADEHVDPVDVTATVIDLAVRGHVQIVEIPAQVGPDWTFRRMEGADKLVPFEQTLLDAIAPATGEAVTVSTISSAVTSVIGKVQSQLYDDVVARGWFSTRPDATRNRWAIAGWVTVVLAFAALVALVVSTKFGLVGIALLATAAGLVVVSHDMPRRTSAGSALLAGLQVLATNLRVQPFDQIAKAKAYTEISEVLPYAVVLGSCERWTKALAAADDDPGVPDPDDLPWYHAGANWSLSDLPASFDAFVVAMQGRLFGRG
ncbi:MAG: DUF2207 domain-containing protein [Propionibacteriaceae bacterium]|jgi:uncharacterized protein (TIGR04222 family)|nr:DUF2207 domain-containing protein [Propionibacteriaceae bacterium]